MGNFILLTSSVGHGKLINIVSFSPDGNLFATASFDKNIKLWTKTGKHLTTFRGHVADVRDNSPSPLFDSFHLDEFRFRFISWRGHRTAACSLAAPRTPP